MSHATQSKPPYQLTNIQPHTLLFSLSSSPNHMFPPCQTRSLKKRRRKSPRKSSPKRPKNTNSCICTVCNLLFENNKNLRCHKKQSNNPKCSPDLVECEVCGTVALNEYGIMVHQRSDMQCIHAQNAIDNTNVILSDGEDCPLSKHQHQFHDNNEPYEDPGLFEIYGSEITSNTNKKKSAQTSFTSFSNSSISNIVSLFCA